jgi:hypothetical protein
MRFSDFGSFQRLVPLKRQKLWTCIVQGYDGDMGKMCPAASRGEEHFSDHQSPTKKKGLLCQKECEASVKHQ